MDTNILHKGKDKVLIDRQGCKFSLIICAFFVLLERKSFDCQITLFHIKHNIYMIKTLALRDLN